MSRAEYVSTLESLYALEAAKGMDFKLERVALALRNLGDPHRRFRSIHIAGTNGKGSVAAMLHSMYGAGGYHVGLYTSPHLVEFRERIRIGGHFISEADVVGYVREIHAAATINGIQLTFFELVTVIAFLHFAREKVDLAVVEVGLGGRLDATNVIDPEASVITTIGLDHEEYLGDSLESIAAEKGGIIKPGKPVVLGNLPPEAVAVVEAISAQCGAPVVRLGRDFEPVGAGQRVGLGGRYQRDNAAVALAVVDTVRAVLPLRDESARQGLENVRWPGRLEVIRDNPLVVLDGAHNVEGVRALVQELPALLQGRRTYLVFGVMRDKRWRSMVDCLAPVVDGVVAVRAEAKRGAAPEEIGRAFAGVCPVWIVESPVDGFAQARQLAGDQGAVVVAGSLFLVGAVYPHLPLPASQRGGFALGANLQQ